MRMRNRLGTFLLALACTAAGHAQISPSAYRVLGQTDLHHDGANMVQGVELNSPTSMAVDDRQGLLHLYIADTGNSRILAWADARSYQIGDPPTLVLAQPTPQDSNPLGIGPNGLYLPLGLAVNPATGDLYVADSGDHRILRFPAPFSNPGRVDPDAVIGQPGFTNHTPNTGGISNASLKGPQAVAFDSAGNLWVADSGNHRVLRFSATVLDGRPSPAADLVVGQKDFSSGGANHSGAGISASGFDSPYGLAFDSHNNLYVSDFNNARVLKFAPPAASDPAAIAVLGQASLTARVISAQPGAATMNGPAGLTVDSSGSVYVAVPAENRVLIFLPGGTSARAVLGQSDFTSEGPNASSFPNASVNSLFTPTDVRVDASGAIYVADSSNNRVLGFAAGSQSASRVWGQQNFSANGANQVKASSIDAPYKMLVDYSRTPFPLYVSDTNNNRVLVWKDAVHFRSGDPADLVIGQPNLQSAAPNVDTRGSQTQTAATSLWGPGGMALDASGNLYVADSMNNRVLRYPRPVDQVGAITPDLVIGQPSFTAASGGLASRSSLRQPAAVALGPDGDVFVSDTGNNRVLEFPSGGGLGAAAIRVYGQPNFVSAVLPAQISSQTLAGPTGLLVDGGFNLYVADTGANRVVVFPSTQTAPVSGANAAYIFGQNQPNTGAPSGGNSGLRAPRDVALDSHGSLYISDSGNNRVLVFPSLLFAAAAGATATGVVGQNTFYGTAPNWNTTDGRATPEGLYGPLGIYVDRRDTLYVGDAGNNRMVHFLKAAPVVNAANFQVGVPVAPGSLASLFSTSLADRADAASSMPWPASLVNRELIVNDTVTAPLYYFGASQVNFQVPGSLSAGSARIAVRAADTGELIAGGSILISATSPGLFTLSRDGKGQAAVLNQNGSLNGSTNAAARGSIITLFGTGQGQVSPPVADGTPAPVSPLSNTVAVPASDANTCLNSQPSMCVLIGTGVGAVQYSGLAPGNIGLWQINVQIPPDAPTGASVPIRVVIDGTPSNIVTVAVR